MAEYIDREALIESVCADCGWDGICTTKCIDLRKIKDYPAADVEPVVRCKDCGNWSANIPDDGWGWCFNSVIGEGERSADCYCAYGAKMEAGE